VQLISASRGDNLSILLERINVRSAVYCLSELGSPWGFSVAGSQVAKFHLVLAGSAVLTMSDADPDQVRLAAGELVLLPRGSAHVMHDGDAAPTPPLDIILAEHPVTRAGRMSYGGDGARTSLLCGGFSLAPGLPAELLGLLPPVLVIDAASHGITRWLGPLFGLLQDEIAGESPGGTAVLAKIADVFLTQVIRSYLSSQDAGTWPASAATADPAVGAALTALWLRPGARWTVAALAREAGMSRTAFAARFREMVGEPPMGYLARLRLARAAGYLAATDKTVQQIARLVGYDSDASLAKAFRRSYGRAPGAYRRQHRGPAAVLVSEFGADSLGLRRADVLAEPVA
jgi:AraC family transcriptional activator of mtrCDE